MKQENKTTKPALGTKWLHLFYIKNPLALIVDFGVCIMGIASSPFLSVIAVIAFLLDLSMFIGYYRHKFFNLYPGWLYYVTIIGLYFVLVMSFITVNPIIILMLLVWAILNHVYFYHRKYLFFEAEEAEEGDKLIEKCVNHKTYGLGMIQKIAKGHLWVVFATGTKKFQHPSALANGELVLIQSKPPIKEPEVKEKEEQRQQRMEEKATATPQSCGTPFYKSPLIDKQVSHKTYGLGVIRKHVKEYLLIEFKTVVKEFMYPASFEQGFLTPIGWSVSAATTPHDSDDTELTDKEIFEGMRRAIQPLWVTTHPPGDVIARKELFVGSRYGTNAQDIFMNCCQAFGWDSSKANDFRKQSLLYSYCAAHGKSPWFLCHHSWIEPASKRLEASWWNIVTREYVYEEWRETDSRFENDWSERITFARTRDGYVYIGVFKPIKLVKAIDPFDGKFKNIKVYRLIQENYRK